MIKPAQNYASVVKSLMWEIAYDLRYKYALMNYSSDYEAERTNYNYHEFVSINEKTDKVLGYIRYEIDQKTNIAMHFYMVSFIDLEVPTFKQRYIFGNDFKTVIDNVFNKFNFNKITFGVTVGNPVEKHYDFLIKKYGGRIVGVYKKHIKLIDGVVCDSKVYELFKEDYKKRRNKKGD